MSLLYQAPFESGDQTAEGLTAFTGVTFATDQAYTQTRSIKFSSGGGTAYAGIDLTAVGATNRDYWAQGAYRIASGSLTARYSLLSCRETTGNAGFAIYVETNGSLTLDITNTAGTVLSSNGLSVTPARDTWFVVDMRFRYNSAADDTASVWVDGVQAGSASYSGACATTAPTAAYCGFSAAGSGVNMWVGHFTINDDQGASENARPGPRKIYMLLPTSDSAVGTGWEGPQTTGSDTTALYDNINNTPPVGVTHADTDANALKYVFNAASTTTGNLDVNVASYTTAGVAANDVVKAVQMVMVTGQPASTARAGALRVVSNPAGSEDSVTTFYAGAVQNTHPTGWKWVSGAFIYAPSVTLGTSPVIRIGKRVANTAVISADFAALIVNVRPVVTATAALTGTGSSTVAGVRTRLGAAALTGTGSSTVSAVHTWIAAAALTGTGSLTASSTGTIIGAAALTGTGSSTVSAVRTRFAAAALTGLGTSTVAGVRKRFGAAALTGTGSSESHAAEGLAYPDGSEYPADWVFPQASATTVTGAASLTGTGTSTITGVRGKVATATLTGTGTATATGVRKRLGAAALTGVGTSTVAGLNTRVTSADLHGTGTATISGYRTSRGAANLTGTGSLAVTSTTRGRVATATLHGTGSEQIAGRRTTHAVAALTGTGTITATSGVTFLAIAHLTGTGYLTATATAHRAYTYNRGNDFTYDNVDDWTYTPAA